MLIRHGARYPLTAEPSKKGQLTNNGLRMSYILGKFIREKYPDFFPKEFNFNDNYVLASAQDRTIMTAQAFMLGLYDFGSLNDTIEVSPNFYRPEWDNFDIVDDIKTPLPNGFQPVPVHSFEKDNNFMFESFNQNLCPKMGTFGKKTSSISKEIISFVQKELPEMRKRGIEIKEVIGKDTIDNLFELYLVCDHVLSNVHLGNIQLEDAYVEKINIFQSMEAVYSTFRDEGINKYLFTDIGLSIKNYIKTAKENIENKKDYQKFVLLTGHDMNLYNFMVLLDLSNYNCLKKKYLGEQLDTPCILVPTFSSNFIFELYRENNEYFIQISYNGYPIKICNNDTDCKYEDFLKKIDDIVDHGDLDFLRGIYCKDKDITKYTMIIALIIFNIIVILFLGYMVYFYRKVLRNKNKEALLV